VGSTLGRVLRVDLKEFFEYPYPEPSQAFRQLAVTIVNDATNEHPRQIVTLLRSRDPLSYPGHTCFGSPDPPAPSRGRYLLPSAVHDSVHPVRPQRGLPPLGILPRSSHTGTRQRADGRASSTPTQSDLSKLIAPREPPEHPG
jgi:hypothetical protein